MTPPIRYLVPVFAVIAGLGALTACALARAAGPGSTRMSSGTLPAASQATRATGGTPVLLELFTSEGCSSCPSADTALAQITAAQAVPGARVVLLAHHVDYWNQLGWPDPFSSATASQRQRAYAPLRSGSYTPQAVIDGQAEMVGSRSGAVTEAVAAAAKRPHARLEIDVTAAKGESLDVAVRVGALPADAADDAELLVAAVQDHARVSVARGENAGRTLEHSAVARDLRTVLRVGKTGGSGRVTLTRPAALEATSGASFSVIAFVQERTSRRVLGTAAAPLAVPGR